MLLKALLSLRLLQSPLALVFLLSVSWTLYLLQHSAATQSQPSHIFTTILRFLAPLLTLPYVCYEIVGALTVLRGRDTANKFTLRAKSRSFKICRVLFEFGIGGLWFFSFVFSLGVGSWSLTGESQVVNSSNGSGSGSSSENGNSNGTFTTTTSGNATVAPLANQTMFIVPPGGKMPMVLGSVMWIGLISLFMLSALAVVIETARNWKAVKPAAVAYEQEMGQYSKGEGA